MDHLGKHILLDLYDCPADLLKNVQQVGQIMIAAAEIMQATIVQQTFHQFSPYGVSGVVVIQESHLTIHTWPEHQYAAIDIFTCGDIRIELGVEYLTQHFRAGRTQLREVRRGEVPKCVD